MGPIMGGAARRPVVFGPNTNVVFDGNSLVWGAGTGSYTETLPWQLSLLSPVSASGTINNLGISGQTIRQMNGLDGGSASDVDAAFIAGKTNVLFVWEATNGICNSGRTGLQTAADTTDYCAARLALNPWAIVLLTTIPRFSTASFGIAGANAELDAYDAYIKANYRAMGAKAVVDVRAAGIFTYTGPTVNATMAPYMYDDIHCNASGYSLIAQYCAAVAATLRR